MIFDTEKGKVYTGKDVFERIIAVTNNGLIGSKSEYIMLGKEVTLCSPKDFIVVTGKISAIEYIVTQSNYDHIQVDIGNYHFRIAANNGKSARITMREYA